MASVQAAKRALRAELKRRLRALGEGEKRRQSGRLARQVMQHARYQASQRIAVFLSLPDEVQTAEIIKDIFQQGKECFIPRYQPHSNHMDMVKLASYQEIASLPVTSWNIHQPAEEDVREEALSGAGERFACGSVARGSISSLCQASVLTEPATGWEEERGTTTPTSAGAFNTPKESLTPSP
uniref:5-formyltetrahydrofolate cyclo-ligase n=1 Tax=Pogona vitticeps TaxID=103695 RepID=A0ABM5EX02_9SAUR